MKIRLVSDLHLSELIGTIYLLPVLSDDSQTILIIAGDLSEFNKPSTYLPFLDDVAKRFMEVFIILGNHEPMGSNIDDVSYEKVIKKQNYHNVHTNKLIMKNEKIAIIGRTLWTSFDDENPITELKSYLKLKDFKRIKIGKNDRKLTVKDLLDLHYKQKKELFDEIDEYIEKGYTIIAVSHHHPSLKSLNPKYGTHAFNHDLATNLEDKIKKRPEILYWFCGHIHKRISYIIGDTKLECNPKGHPDEVSGWNPKLYFDI